ncbi:MAG: alpha/beta hydrolase [Pseudolabrys sp.]|nr:alpha/beta hydrolase [Pseudolabrys sp.]
MPIDYEKEYDNRARVPEHPEIFARWERETAAYRAGATGAQLGISYGPSPRQTIDWFPGQDAGPDAPVAMFIHGGWWRTLDPSMFSQMAKGLNAHGVTVAVAGYDLVPQVTVAAIIEQMRAAALFLWRQHRKRFVAIGHSAGGHLAACLVATDWKTLEPGAPADLVPLGYGISGVYDAAPVLKISANADIRLDENSARAVSPLYWRVPAGRGFDAAVGGIESAEFLRQSKIIVEAWRQAGAATRYREIAGANHFTAIDPLADAASPMTERVVELARQAQGISR